jgi:hypothetical protein
MTDEAPTPREEDVPQVPRPDVIGVQLEPGMEPEDVEIPPPPSKEAVDNQDAEAAVAFLKVGVPLQDGTPDDPDAELAKLRKANR